jgi:uncharacterized protein (DUF1800 family)
MRPVRSRGARRGLLLLVAAALAALAGCAPPGSIRPDRPANTVDAPWLERLTYGINSSALAEYQRLGQSAFLDAQLGTATVALPAAVEAQIQSLEITHADPARLLADLTAENKRINALADGPEKEQARRAFNEHGNKLAYEAARRHLLRAIYSPAQLREQLGWFWLNFFNVHQYKANVRWLVGDYEERAIRPHVLGRFRDLVMATLTHPAMLQYLDNAQNAAGHLNENYARELMELHTLGVDGGYTQQDVQALARILTGAGVSAGGAAPRLRPDWQPLYRRSGAFEFNPARHDFSDKTLLGHTIAGRGMPEIEEAVDLLVRQPACARFVARRLAQYFVADDPPRSLIDRMARAFAATDGEIGAVMRTMLASPEYRASLGGKFKDPMHYLISSLRLAYDGRVIVNAHPIVNWLNSLGEPLYGRQTPDGYPLVEAGWASSGQLSRRFEIARAIANGSAGLFEPEDGSSGPRGGFPQLASHVYYDAFEPRLSATTRQALERATSQVEWNTFLLASPEFNYR